MKIAIVIPSRYESKRFKGKPLAKILGKSMIQRVYEQCKKSKIKDVLVATDDDRIYKEVNSFGGSVIMTSDSHKSGTERIYEVLKNSDFDWIINVQGDEPLISPYLINNISDEIRANNYDVITAIRKNTKYSDFVDKNIVKVVLDKDNVCLYFSRLGIPYKPKENFDFFYQHIGIYAYSRKAIEMYFNSGVTDLENYERLEQLRFLYLGIKIKAIVTDYLSIGVDRRDDIKKIEEILKKNEKN